MQYGNLDTDPIIPLGGLFSGLKVSSQGLITKRLEEGNKKRDIVFKKKMSRIINSLPIESSRKEKLLQELEDLGTDFARYCQCQANLTDEEDPDTWAAALLDLAVVLLDTVEEENPTIAKKR